MTVIHIETKDALWARKAQMTEKKTALGYLQL